MTDEADTAQELEFLRAKIASQGDAIRAIEAKVIRLEHMLLRLMDALREIGTGERP